MWVIFCLAEASALSRSSGSYRLITESAYRSRLCMYMYFMCARSAKPTDYAIFCCTVVYHVHFHQGNPCGGAAMARRYGAHPPEKRLSDDIAKTKDRTN